MLYNKQGKTADWSEVPGIVACDIETTGLDYRTNDINIIQVGTDKDQWYILECSEEDIAELAKRRLIFHNGKFDTVFIAYHHNVLFDIAGDTMVLLHALGYNGSLSLKNTAMSLLKVPDWNINLDTKTGISAEMIEYALKDVEYTYRMYKELIKDIDRKQMNVYKSELLAFNAFRYIEIHGSKVGDTVSVMKELNEERDAIQQYMDIDLSFSSSPKKVGKILFTPEGLGIKPKVFTASGAPSTAGEVLQDIRFDNDFIYNMHAYKGVMKLQSFVKSWSNLSRNGRIHPNFNILAATGRTTCKEPNLQQVPKNGHIRNLVTADTGCKFIEADYSQLELRVAAYVSGDRNMTEAYRQGKDLHTLTASFLFPGESDEVIKSKRGFAKACNFGLIYGMSANSFADFAKKYGAKITKAEAKELRTKFFEGYPGLIAWHKRSENELTMKGYSETKTGRRRYLPDVYSHRRSEELRAKRQASNSEIQGLGSDIMLAALVMMCMHEEFGKTFWIHGTIHDAVLVSALEEHAEHVALDIVKPIMEKPYILGLLPDKENLTLKADVSIGSAWGKKELEF